MKNKTLLKYLFLFLVAGTSFTSCNSDDDTTTPIAYETADISKFDLSTGQATAGGKIWDKTFTEDTALEIGVFNFSHFGAVMPTYKYWNGFTVSNSSDNTDQSTKQGRWSENQWGTMPEGGVAGKGTPFIVAYASEKPENDVLVPGKKLALENYNSWVKIDDDTNTYTAQSVNLAISPWPYYEILNGGDFSRKFEKGDYFALHIYGLDKDQKLVDASPITHYFVDYRNGITPINTKWSTVDLKSLGEVKYLVFFLETTDVGQFGANTALYFTMDRLTVEKVVK